MTNTGRGLGMYSKGNKKGTIRFAYKPDMEVKKVELAGDFNNWVPSRMRKQKDGSYVSNVGVIVKGKLEYKYVVDGDWRTDPDNSSFAVNEYGVNSVAQAD